MKYVTRFLVIVWIGLVFVMTGAGGSLAPVSFELASAFLALGVIVVFMSHKFETP